VVSDFLSFARDLPLHRQPVDVRALLEDVRSLKASGGGPLLEVECLVAGAFLLDRGRVKECLLNLVGNAMQATPAGGKVRLCASLERDGRLLLEVTDTGTGMDEVTVARAFTPFFTTKEKGSGLGLPLVKKFARDHGGDARLASEPGRGTTVSLLLAPGPVGPAVADEPALLGDDEPALLG
jgi:signal transduction histidine kinase